MTAEADVGSGDFRFSMLLYDRRYRSITIQVLALLGFLLFVSWLVMNTVHNLQVQGKDFNFGFLWTRSGYDINQYLIDYDSNATHFRAALVGLLNTLLAAVVGCILATIIGVVVGVLRLSKNWLTARLMTVYVEGLRNVPVVLWILALFAIMTNVTPAPNAFRGESPTASMLFDETVAFTNRGTYIPFPHMTWQLGVFFLVLIASIAAAWFVRRESVRKLEAEGAEPIAGWKIAAIAVVPTLALMILGAGFSFAVTSIIRLAVLAGLIYGSILAFRAIGAALAPSIRQTVTALGTIAVVLLWLLWLGPIVWNGLFPAIGLDPTLKSFVPLDAPALRGFNFQGGLKIENSFVALTIALALYTGAFIAENVRAGIMAISKGQSEAAYALGLRPGRTMSLVILPQALRVIIPPLISQWLNLTKNTSLGLAVSYMDLRSTLGGITLNQTGRELECMLLMMLIYLIISLIISSFANFYNRSVQLRSR